MPFLRIISKMETRPVNFLDENKTKHFTQNMKASNLNKKQKSAYHKARAGIIRNHK